MSIRYAMVIVTLAVIVSFLSPGPVRADAIDGDWCFTDGRNMSIDGPKIRTPVGKQMEGDYDRHAFSYKIPAGEPGTGLLVFMILVDDDTIRLQMGKDSAGASNAPVEMWHRCNLQTS